MGNAPSVEGEVGNSTYVEVAETNDPSTSDEKVETPKNVMDTPAKNASAYIIESEKEQQEEEHPPSIPISENLEPSVEETSDEILVKDIPEKELEPTTIVTGTPDNEPVKEETLTVLNEDPSKRECHRSSNSPCAGCIIS